MMDILNLIPPELLINIALYLPFYFIVNLCLTNSNLKEIIDTSEYLWEQKFLYNYRESGHSIIEWCERLYIETNQSWKELYRKYMMSKDLWACGNNSHGQLCLNHNRGKNIFSQIANINVKQVYAKYNHTFVIDETNNLWSCGQNDFHQLGSDSIFDIKNVLIQIPNVKTKQVSTGQFQVMIIDINNNLWVYGVNNRYGQLGLGEITKTFISEPTQILGLQAKQVSVGTCHTVVLDLEGNIWVCGNNNNGQLGLGETSNKSIFTQIPNIKAQQIAAGEYHTVILDEDNNIWTCGSNQYGQLGLGHWKDTPIHPSGVCYDKYYKLRQLPNIKAKYIACGTYTTMIIDLDDNIWVCGSNFNGKLGIGQNEIGSREYLTQIPNIKAKKIVGDSNTMAVIDLEDNAWICGYNETTGQLGLGDYKNRNKLTKIENFKVKDIALGHSHTIMLAIKLN